MLATCCCTTVHAAALPWPTWDVTSLMRDVQRSVRLMAAFSACNTFFEVVCWMLVISTLGLCAGKFLSWYCSLLVIVHHISVSYFVHFCQLAGRNREIIVMVATWRKLQSWLRLTASSVSALDLSPHFHGNDTLRLIKTSSPCLGHSVTLSVRVKLWGHQNVLPLSLLSN